MVDSYSNNKSRDRRFADRQPPSFSLNRKENEAKETLFISVAGFPSTVGEGGGWIPHIDSIAVAAESDRL